MKLYATVRSNRASKGQGGDALTISIYDAERVEVATLRVDDTPEGIRITYDIDEDVAYIEKAKGEKEKGETELDRFIGKVDMPQ